jgi:hypothetical protein
MRVCARLLKPSDGGVVTSEALEACAPNAPRPKGVRGVAGGGIEDAFRKSLRWFSSPECLKWPNFAFSVATTAMSAREAASQRATAGNAKTAV